MSLTADERARALAATGRVCPACGDELVAHDDGVTGAYVVCDSCGWMAPEAPTQACEHPNGMGGAWEWVGGRDGHYERDCIACGARIWMEAEGQEEALSGIEAALQRAIAEGRLG